MRPGLLPVVPRDSKGVGRLGACRQGSVPNELSERGPAELIRSPLSEAGANAGLHLVLGQKRSQKASQGHTYVTVRWACPH